MRLYVGNMPFNTGESELRALFEAHGRVTSATVITDRETGRSRGFGFVEMEDEESGKKAIEALDKHMVNGRPLVVNKARPRAGGGGGRPGGGGRGHGGGGGRDRHRDREDRW